MDVRLWLIADIGINKVRSTSHGRPTSGLTVMSAHDPSRTYLIKIRRMRTAENFMYLAVTTVFAGKFTAHLRVCTVELEQVFGKDGRVERV